jgi:hypothetical protein
MSCNCGEIKSLLNQVLAKIEALDSQYVKKQELVQEICSNRDAIVLCLRDSEQWYDSEIDLREYLLNG